MSEDGTAADVVLDRDYPNVDFTPRVITHDEFCRSSIDKPPVLVPNRLRDDWPRKPPRPHWFLRFYRMLRKLIRQRQESAVVKSVRWQAREDLERERKLADDRKRIAAAETSAARASDLRELATLTKRIEQRDAALSELRQKMDLKVEELTTTIASREKDIKDYVERDIPKLQRELEVTRAEVKYWKTLVAEKLIHEEAQIAVDNKRITDAEAVIEQIRQSNALQQLMERGR